MSIRDDLKAYIDGELTPSREAEVRQALESDPSLQAEVIELRQIGRVIHEESYQPEPVGMESTLLALETARRRQPQPGRQKLGLIWAFGLAASLMFAVMVVPRVIGGTSADEAATGSPAADGAAASVAKAATSPAPNPQAEAGRSPSDGDFEHQRSLDKAVTVPNGAGGLSQRPAEEFARSSKAAGRNVAKPTVPVNETKSLSNGTSRGVPSGGEMADHKASAAGGPALQVRNGVLTVEVANVAQTQAAAGRLARALQGRVERSGNSVMAGEKPTAEVVIKVPVARFDRAIEQVRALGRVVTESTKDDDVTVHVADSEARLRALRSEEAQYQTIMKGTKKVEEVLKVKSRMSQVRQQIEGLDAQRKVLREQALMSTITIHLSQKPAPSAPTKSGGLIASDWESASSGLSAVGRAAAGAGVYVLVFSPVWIPIGGLGYFLWRKTAARFA